ncbi:MAG: efflux RND transporter permease subunit [Bdellovibrio sp.]|nr:efflux RND transporter permease subunit [Bdellovibrio sp.]
MSSKGFSLARLSISRPVFISCLVALSIILGRISLSKLPIDIFPDVTFPIVSVITPYPGAGPKEIETIVSKVFEEEFSTIAGVKRISAIAQEGVSIVVTEFNFNIDIKQAEQQIRDKVTSARTKLPRDVKESVIRRIDPADQPIITMSLKADLAEAELFDLANLVVKPKFEQVLSVGMVEIIGGRKREIRVELDLKKLKEREISALQIADSLGKSGMNIPVGKMDVTQKQETVFRTVGEFQSLDEIKNTLVSFYGNEMPTTLANVAEVKQGLEDQKNIGYVNGDKALFINVYKQSGANTVAVSKDIAKQIETLNAHLKNLKGNAFLTLVRNGAKPIEDNILDVSESIYFGIALTVIVVFFFLGSFRSTLITGLALPNSLLGAFILVSAAGFSINIMSLLALSLAVGLLVDDAIVVRENIYRHLEMGKDAKTAALDGAHEVMLAVVATTMTVLAVFGPIAFLDGVVGQFFKQFGLTICFALIISLFDALTIAPMMSAYFVGKIKGHDDVTQNQKKTFYDRILGGLVVHFTRFQDWLADVYIKILGITLNHPLKTLFSGVVIFALSIMVLKYVPKTFVPAQDNGEFAVNLELPPGTSLSEMNRVSMEVDKLIRAHQEVLISVLTVGTKDGESNKASFYVRLVSPKMRKVNTIRFKAMIRDELTPFAFAKPSVRDYDFMGAGMRPFSLNIQGPNEEELEKIATNVFEKLRHHPSLTDVDLSFRPGKPEFQVIPDRFKSERLGVSTNVIGSELRTLMQGQTPAVFRMKGEEYDIRIRLKEDQRNLAESFSKIYVPNMNYRLIQLKNVSGSLETTGPATITRQDRQRYYQIGADIAPDGPGMGGAVNEVKRIFRDEIKLPEEMGYRFVGQAENFQELIISMLKAAGLGTLLIYLVLASLYESYILPFTIMMVLPLGLCGAFFALFLTKASLDLFSMIGCIMLLGVATKNSIILVDYIKQQISKGLAMREAILKAGRDRLRPILMTSFALAAGMSPIAIGLNEASKQRTSMGIALIGGIISSTFLSLLIVPVAFTYLERFRLWSGGIMKRIFIGKVDEPNNRRVEQ